MKSPRFKRLSNVFSFVHDSGSRHKSTITTTTTTTKGIDEKPSISNVLSKYQYPPASDRDTRQAPAEPLQSDSPIILARRAVRSNSRKMSLGSVSSYSSDYSDSEDDDFSGMNEDLVLGSGTALKRRATAPSRGASDRRRVAIVQMEALEEAMNASGTNSTVSSIRSRRGFTNRLAGLALVAPPDAAPGTYTHLTPPSTAPPTTKGPTSIDTRSHRLDGFEKPATGLDAGIEHGPYDRDIGPAIADVRDKSVDKAAVSTNSDTFDSINNNNGHNPAPSISFELLPAGQGLQPQSSSSTVAASRSFDRAPASGQLSATTSLWSPPMTTPEIGASKEIHVPVAAPVVVDLTSSHAVQPRSTIKIVSSTKSNPISNHQRDGSSAFDSVETTPFLAYQPGFHATAGPLPPPPRAAFPIAMLTPPPPRPPRLNSPVSSRMKTDLEAVKQALQLPAAVTAKLAKTVPPPPLSEVKPLKHNPRRDATPKNPPQPLALDNSEKQSSVSSLPPTRSAHRREGAFPSSSASRSIVDGTVPEVVEKKVQEAVSTPTRSVTVHEEDRGDSVPTVTIVREELKADAEELVKTKEADDSLDEPYQPSHLSLVRSPSPGSSSENSSPRREMSSPPHDGPFRRSLSPSPSSAGSNSHYQTQSQRRSQSPLGISSNSAPSPPPKSFRNSFNLSTNLKRFSSLPRTPSRAESRRSDLEEGKEKRSSAGTQISHRSSRTPSPVAPRRISRRKILDYNPPAMFCHEVYQQRTSAERCQIYIEKINELYAHDCGLSAWLIEMQYRGAASTVPPRGPSFQPFQPQPRHTSRSSMISEATFPRRPDAIMATDLSAAPSLSYQDVSPATVAVNLPYPSLATQQRQQSIRSTASTGSGITPPSSIRSLASQNTNTKTGFFASLGRKASMRERAGMSLNHSNSVATTKTVPSTKDISRPILVSTTNSTHGHGNASRGGSPVHTGPSGPRALPPNRAQRSKTLIAHTPRYNVEREDALGRRPSLFDLSTPAQQTQVDPEFVAQVDKLHNLLPHADRAVLAGYLRRAGQDVLAIGQYLEDERNGTLRYI